MIPALREIEEAQKNIGPYIHKTPLVHSSSFSLMTEAEVWFKCENLQKTGSFKVRGSFNKIIKAGAKKVIAASMGNHAQGVAYAAARLGIKAKIVMPETVSIVKESATRGYGAEVVLKGETLSEALEYALSLKGYAFIHPFDDNDVIAGQGTIGLEIADEMEDMDAVVVPVGGGGLISGIAIALKEKFPKIQVHGVQCEGAQSAFVSFHEKAPKVFKARANLADGISVSKLGEKTLAIINKYVHEMHVVGDEEIAKAILLLMERKKLIVEGAGAVPLALLLKNPEHFRGKKVVLIASGGNIDSSLIDKIVRRGLVAEGRVGSFTLVIDDMPGSLNKVTSVIAAKRGNIITIAHERLAEGLPLGKTKVHFVIETRSREHLEEILSELNKEGKV
jgi:threonine dehydratase